MFTERRTRIALFLLGGFFAGFFVAVVVPALISDRDLIGGITAGFENPYAAGYSTDAIVTWLVLAVWILYERQHSGVRRGWVALVIGLVPGVAVGLAGYLLIRWRQPHVVSA